MRRCPTFNAFVLFGLLLAFVLSGQAQSGNQGSIEGVLTDPSGAAVAGALVTVRQLETAATISAASDQNGLFHFPVLLVGQYELFVEQAGFTKLTLKGLVVTVGARVDLVLTLQLAEVAESVVVTARTPVVETTRSQVSTTVGSRLVTDLPINGRDFAHFALLTPGVTRDVRGGLSFAGQRAMNSLLVDGANNDDGFFGQPLGSTGFSPGGRSPFQFSQEAVQEFQVNSNAYSAELGRAGGGVINVVTKSGTNELHGAAFEFYRDKSMNATDPVNKLNGQPKDPFHFHQFGGAAGGPLVKSKLFIFANYEGLRSTVPNAVFLNLPAGFVLSTDATVAGFQQRALDYLTSRAAVWAGAVRQNIYLTKLDWHISPAHLFSGRWNRQRFRGRGEASPQNSFEHTVTHVWSTDTLAVALTSALAASLVNVARFSYVRSDAPVLPEGINPEANIFEGGQLVLSIGRVFNTPQERVIRGGQWSDTLSYVRGRHSFKTGTDLVVDRITFLNAQSFSGSHRFNSLESFGRSLAGTPVPQEGEQYLQAFSGDGTPGSITHPNFVAFATFVQDEWRVRNNLTLNFGLRYDLQGIAHPPVKNPSPALAAAGIDTSFLRRDKNNFAPRLGIAWSPLRSNRLVVRVGYGLFYALTPALLAARAHDQNGVSVQLRTFVAGRPSAALIPAYPNTLCGAPDPSGTPPSCAAPVTGAGPPLLMFFAPNYTEPYVQHGSLGVEVRLGRELALLASYIVSKGTHLQHVRDINLALPTVPTQIGIAGTSTLLTFQKFLPPRPLADFDALLEFQSGGSSIHHGLIMQVTKRFSANFEFLASYTLGKTIDDNPNVYAVSPTTNDGGRPSDPSNLRADRGAGSNDQRHRFVLSGIWELDYTKRFPTWAKAILGGWQASGILSAQSGQPYSALVSFDLNNDGNALTDRTPGLGRNTFYLPATVSFDPRLSRNVRLTERLKLQFIWEAFNVLNRTNITAVRTTQYARFASAVICGIARRPCLVPQNAGLRAFGIPTASSGPRIMQLSVKLVF